MDPSHDPPSPRSPAIDELTIEFSRQSPDVQVDESLLRDVVTGILRDAGIRSGEISLATVDDARIRPLNRQYLGHDYATDVLSFLMVHDGQRLDGEVIVSAETARRVSQELDWPESAELLLYFIHGTLHLVGHDDHDADARREMRRLELKYLVEAGVARPLAASRLPDAAPELTQ